VPGRVRGMRQSWLRRHLPSQAADYTGLRMAGRYNPRLARHDGMTWTRYC